MTADAPIFFRVEVVDVTPFGLVTESRGQCTASDRVWKWLTALLVLHGVLIMWGNVLTYRLRNVPSDYNEGKYVGFSIANCMQTSFLALLILFLISDNPCAEARHCSRHCSRHCACFSRVPPSRPRRHPAQGEAQPQLLPPSQGPM